MRSLFVLVLIGASLALLAGCQVITQDSSGGDESENDRLDIEVGREDYVNGESPAKPD